MITLQSLQTIESSEYRREIKFTYPSTLDKKSVCARILLNTAGFQEIYNGRSVHSLYYDTPDFKMLNDTLAGTFLRAKFRTRWYNNDPSLSLQFEIKAKRGQVNQKHVKKLSEFPTARDLKLLYPSLLLKPIAFVTYNRRYFLSQCNCYRLTLDTEIKFSKYSRENLAVHPSLPYSHNVIEIKYNSNDERNVTKITNQLGLRLSKNSKYSSAIENLF